MAGDWDQDTTQTEVPTTAGADRSQPSRPCITVLTGTATGRMFELGQGPTIVGRDPKAAIQLIDDGVSRHHAQIRNDGQLLWVADLGSRNGTYVNGVRITGETVLNDGDKLQVGRAIVLRFAFHDELDQSFHENLVSSALRDPLTRLFNKRYFLDRLDGELKFALRHHTPLTLLMLDVDHFKRVNDTHGHLAGDALLVRLGEVISHAVRNEDVVARFGGEELVVILRSTTIDAATLLADRLRRVVEQTTVAHGGRDVRATVSIGIASYPTLLVATPQELLEAADKALYRAKHAGRNRVSQ